MWTAPGGTEWCYSIRGQHQVALIIRIRYGTALGGTEWCYSIRGHYKLV
jgi:hypothetical protein